MPAGAFGRHTQSECPHIIVNDLEIGSYYLPMQVALKEVGCVFDVPSVRTSNLGYFFAVVTPWKGDASPGLIKVVTLILDGVPVSFV